MRHDFELTVKHVGPNGTTLYPTNRAYLTADSRGLEFPVTRDGLLVERIEDGTVYVMNGHGKTVMSHDFVAPDHRSNP